MTQSPFRFLHAADFHLERPVHDLVEVPDHLRELLIECPYTAASAVFDTALREEVDFVVLTGDLVQPDEAGPRGMLFLIEQFQRLAERNINIYWAGGSVDSSDWPTLAWPGNVRRFTGGEARRWLEPIGDRGGVGFSGAVQIFGANDDEFTGLDIDADSFSLALVNGEFEPFSAEWSKRHAINYWAICGKHQRATPVDVPGRVIHSPGSPQGRCPAQFGPRGCTLVHVDALLQVNLVFIPTDAVRFISERTLIEPGIDRARLERMLIDRLDAIVAQNSATPLVISWILEGTSASVAKFREGRLIAELLGRMRSEYGYRPTPAWVADLQVAPALAPPDAWHEQDTVLGEYLRQLRDFRTGAADLPPMDHFLPESNQPGALAAAMSLVGGERRQAAIDQAAWLGVDLLGGESPPHEIPQAATRGDSAVDSWMGMEEVQ